MLTLFSALFILTTQTLPSLAEENERILSILQSKLGYHCKATADKLGSICKDKSNHYMLVPNNLPALNSIVFYAHGQTAVCGPGVSGENYLLGHMAKLQKLGAVAFFPYREDAFDTDFPFSDLIQQISTALQAQNVPWSMVGHSAGGEFLAYQLAHNPAALRKVSKILLLDAAFCVAKPCHGREYVVNNWRKVTGSRRDLVIQSISSVTTDRSELLLKLLRPGAMVNRAVNTDHCVMPRYFDML